MIFRFAIGHLLKHWDECVDSAVGAICKWWAIRNSLLRGDKICFVELYRTLEKAHAGDTVAQALHSKHIFLWTLADAFQQRTDFNCLDCTSNCHNETNMNRYWVLLLIAAGLEVVWAIGLKFTEGFSRLWPSIGTVLAMAVSMYLLARAAAGLPIGTAYAVWTGIGAVGTALAGMFLLNESRDWARIICIGFVVLGVVGLKVFSK
jgi:quaternary ammonium compound-resistance protein SugE